MNVSPFHLKFMAKLSTPLEVMIKYLCSGGKLKFIAEKSCSSSHQLRLYSHLLHISTSHLHYCSLTTMKIIPNKRHRDEITTEIPSGSFDSRFFCFLLRLPHLRFHASGPGFSRFSLGFCFAFYCAQQMMKQLPHYGLLRIRKHNLLTSTSTHTKRNFEQD